MDNNNLTITQVNDLLRKNLDLIQEKIPDTTDDYKRIFNFFIG
jgi:hypothetical protein